MTGPEQPAPKLTADERATRLAPLMTADTDTTDPDDDPWTVQEVLAVAVERGLDALERHYLKGEAKP